MPVNIMRISEGVILQNHSILIPQNYPSSSVPYTSIFYPHKNLPIEDLSRNN
uniref:Uncharacterized protein n=1 Tax=Rhizophora mucronata TaxID=61149 RepID=A0A2P2PM18_RHIMU